MSVAKFCANIGSALPISAKEKATIGASRPIRI
jgi:hypothetical protein